MKTLPLLMALLFVVNFAYGQTPAEPPPPPPVTEPAAEPATDQSLDASLDRLFDYRPKDNPDKPRNLWAPPLISLLLPGFDQWWESQYPQAVFYTGTAVVGANIMAEAVDGREIDDLDIGDMREFDDRERQFMYGAQLYQTAGELSAYHSFRTAAHSRKSSGQFNFLPEDETTGDLLLAPFHLENFLKPTTFVPLLLLSGVAISDLNGDSNKRELIGKDWLFATGISYNAGVGEEAFFRGYLMPELYQSFGSEFWSNTVTALLFGAAHFSSSNRAPVAQALMGYYFGWMTQRNNWSITESIFLHTWWDIIAISYTLAANVADREVGIYLPLVQMGF